MTKPFMIDMQCGATSTTITIPNEMMEDADYIYNTRVQTFEATNIQNTFQTDSLS